MAWFWVRWDQIGRNMQEFCCDFPDSSVSPYCLPGKTCTCCNCCLEQISVSARSCFWFWMQPKIPEFHIRLSSAQHLAASKEMHDTIQPDCCYLYKDFLHVFSMFVAQELFASGSSKHCVGRGVPPVASETFLTGDVIFYRWLHYISALAPEILYIKDTHLHFTHVII